MQPVTAFTRNWAFFAMRRSLAVKAADSAENKLEGTVMIALIGQKTLLGGAGQEHVVCSFPELMLDQFAGCAPAPSVVFG